MSKRKVFPTGVGMNRRFVPSGPLRPCVPHRRGDEPAKKAAELVEEACSPQAWG